MILILLVKVNLNYYNEKMENKVNEKHFIHFFLIHFILICRKHEYD